MKILLKIKKEENRRELLDDIGFSLKLNEKLLIIENAVAAAAAAAPLDTLLQNSPSPTGPSDYYTPPNASKNLGNLGMSPQNVIIMEMIMEMIWR